MKIILSIIFILFVFLAIKIFDSETTIIDFYDIGIREDIIEDNIFTIPVQRQRIEDIKLNISGGSKNLIALEVNEIKLQITDKGIITKHISGFKKLEKAIDSQSILLDASRTFYKKYCDNIPNCTQKIREIGHEFILFHILQDSNISYHLVRTGNYEPVCTYTPESNISYDRASYYINENSYGIYFYDKSEKKILYMEECSAKEGLNAISLQGYSENFLIPVQIDLLNKKIHYTERYANGLPVSKGILDLNDKEMTNIRFPYTNKMFFRNYILSYQFKKEEKKLMMSLYDISTNRVHEHVVNL
ncbi:MAG: hypothetical protein OEY19_12475 [Gammaproteobacteria bacterium]|nr:hypothetical protein [Gammaproteobacteria bacterium]MDH5630258.1 hypothetical protein [Gammaproteobacteria bacterium]